ncbi:MAG: DEAD/DEAH box helicase [Chitinophagaceae bacterium]|nr:DEAD/DEAH box helicase [Chitinophagaceae bacterium]
MQEELAISEILTRLNITELNPMQQASIGANKTNDNVILLSDTGTGKTLAYLLPVLQLLDKTKKGTQALIIAPTRELALQIEKVFRSMTTGFKVTCCYGGHLRETEENNLLQAPALIIGTPGRLADHIRRENIKTNTITTLVLDEFDKSLELGFQEEISFIINSLGSIKKTILVSATEAIDIPDYLNNREYAKLNYLSDAPAESLAYQLVKSPDKDKLETLFSFLCFTGGRSSIIFCNHRESVERVSEYLTSKAIVNVFYHGAMEQPQRDTALCKFRNGTSNILVTTDLAARGLDIPHIRYIIHYHLPASEETFTHRNGRTARMDASGTAVIIIGPDEKIPAFVPTTIKEIKLPAVTTIPEKPKWSTLFIAAGKKDKINKVDIVGFLSNRANLKKEDIGLIEVKDFLSFVAVRKTHVSNILQQIKNEKIKNKKVKIDIAK